jgi:antitoxin CcdA
MFYRKASAHHTRGCIHAHNMRMNAITPLARKRPVNLSLNEALVAQAKTYTSNLSATLEVLLGEFVAAQQQARLSRQQAAAACAEDWNAVHAVMGSFADEHSTL